MSELAGNTKEGAGSKPIPLGKRVGVKGFRGKRVSSIKGGKTQMSMLFRRVFGTSFSKTRLYNGKVYKLAGVYEDESTAKKSMRILSDGGNSVRGIINNVAYGIYIRRRR